MSSCIWEWDLKFTHFRLGSGWPRKWLWDDSEMSASPWTSHEGRCFWFRLTERDLVCGFNEKIIHAVLCHGTKGFHGRYIKGAHHQEELGAAQLYGREKGHRCPLVSQTWRYQGEMAKEVSRWAADTCPVNSGLDTSNPFTVPIHWHC